MYLVAYLNEGNKYAFQKEHFFLFNLALGGPGTGYTGNTTVDDNFQSATMHVDYVRVYQGGSTEIETTTREIVSPDGDFSGLTYKASNNNQDLSVAFYEGKTDDEVNYCLDQGDKFYVATWGKKVKPQFKRVECNGDVQESPSPGANFWIPMSALKKNAYNLVTVQDNNENEFHFVIKYGTPPVVETTTPEVTTPETTTLEVTTPEETTTPAQITNKEINLLGYQISTSYEGVRVAANVEPVIDGQQVKKWGFIYGLKNYGNKDTGITDDDMYVGTTNSYVKSYESTSAGTLQSQLGDSATATYFARTMKFGGSTVTALTADYKVRAYAVLADGSYAYSDVSDYSIAKVADKLYQGKLMNTKSSHSYLYENILSKVFKDYEEVDFIWNNTVVKPEEVED